MDQIVRFRLCVFFSVLFSLSAYTQEFFVNADIVSSYIWRGMKLGDISIQPTMGVTVGGFSAYAWGSTDFHENNSEIDIYLEYEYKGLKVGIADYFMQEGDKPSYFDYKAHTTYHTFDFIVGYTISENFPLSFEWSTAFAGSDYKENEKRAYSSYFEIAYPFSIKGFDFRGEIGVTPWEGMYADGFSVTNVGLSITREIKITDKFSLPLSGKLIANPFEEQMYFVFGISL